MLAPGEPVPSGARIDGFKAILPASDETCRQQIASAMRRGLPEAVLQRRRMTIIANGPSARQVDLAAINHPTMAVNGSLKLFLEQGVVPHYWAACDPQALVADFLPDTPPLDTIYLVAAKCHPSVFDKLAHRQVRVWNLTDHKLDSRLNIPTCSSITMSAAWLAYRMGFTDFDFWGWDGCFMDGLHHASEAPTDAPPPLYVNYGGTVEGENVTGGRNYPTTVSWAMEAEDAGQFFQLARYFNIGVTIHGDGMFRAAQESILSD